ncbi:MAG: NAD(P)/FAD-dependent oxidoreductase [Rhodospirillaceae bacterium]|jgi:cation diffusion facilitator CzcD-associated flavoprotein CzcO|nr:NAD(P)/FAD-dependent oxidoreductase [Rhodospirillaceae bacterium]MBT5194084.1 NAD(P)/FAD-dependent oxidoreductase [Rhodospirillaceae bacterium]MBT5898451.1 NAD(P)/FAD-dependent oxidoreductase [Rhodospirillaceae bacterium]MBT6427631.1 NAD(P)/FAD-dependent oxidoreductase [Rhodospirillaceae bacterium]
MSKPHDYDVVIIGAGMSGMYQLHLLRKLGFSVRVFEAGTGVGGTWYWNRYPGARFDSESYSYGYSFSEEVLQEWDWSEHFAAQPETLRYLDFVADKFDLRTDIQFRARVASAIFDDGENCWDTTLEDGTTTRSRFLITAVGPLSTPAMPAIPGIEDFRGESYHTGTWPHEDVGFAGKRVAVIGTGATGVQTIQEVAKTVGQLTVFQRSPNYCAPLHNSPIDDDTQAKIKASYDEIFAQCNSTHSGFLHDADPRFALQVSDQEREAFYEQRYGEPGFGIWMGNFRDIFVDQDANDTISEFVKNKIRQRVKDPATAEKLIPHNHGFGTRRVPLETGYYEVYNQDNVDLVDIKDMPIDRITATGLECGGKAYEFDMIIYATGFDAVTGGFDKIDIRGLGGRRLKDKWVGGPRTYLGLQVEGFPNMLTLVGPHNAATFCNIPRCIEQNVEWVAELFDYIKAHDIKRIAPTLEAEDAWTEHVYDVGSKLLFTKVDSWFTGINRNIEGKDKRTFLLYAGGAPAYREKCDNVAANNYEGFVLQ